MCGEAAGSKAEMKAKRKLGDRRQVSRVGEGWDGRRSIELPLTRPLCGRKELQTKQRKSG